MLTKPLTIRFASANPFVNHFLVVEIQLSKIFPLLVVVQSDVRDDEGVIVRVIGLALVHHTHCSPNKLNVRRERTEWTEDRCDTQWRMIEPLAEHLYLHNAIDPTASQILGY